MGIMALVLLYDSDKHFTLWFLSIIASESKVTVKQTYSLNNSRNINCWGGECMMLVSLLMWWKGMMTMIDLRSTGLINIQTFNDRLTVDVEDTVPANVAETGPSEEKGNNCTDVTSCKNTNTRMRRHTLPLNLIFIMVQWRKHHTLQYSPLQSCLYQSSPILEPCLQFASMTICLQKILKKFVGEMTRFKLFGQCFLSSPLPHPHANSTTHKLFF